MTFRRLDDLCRHRRASGRHPDLLPGRRRVDPGRSRKARAAGHQGSSDGSDAAARASLRTSVPTNDRRGISVARAVVSSRRLRSRRAMSSPTSNAPVPRCERRSATAPTCRSRSPFAFVSIPTRFDAIHERFGQDGIWSAIRDLSTSAVRSAVAEPDVGLDNLRAPAAQRPRRDVAGVDRASRFARPVSR